MSDRVRCHLCEFNVLFGADRRDTAEWIMAEHLDAVHDIRKEQNR